MSLLSEHPQLFVPDKEYCIAPPELTDGLYDEVGFNESDKGNQIRGVKCPNHIVMHGSFLATLPHLKKLIIGVRHPVRWFESFWNFKQRTLLKQGGSYHPIDELIGSGFNKFHPSTDGSRFHLDLATLGKTQLSKSEIEFLPPMENISIGHSNATIFLYEASQLSQEDTHIFRTMLQNFLNLKIPIAEVPQLNHIPKEEKRKMEDNSLIDICEEKYFELRQILLGHGKQAHEWILRYFIKSNDVYVPNLDEFRRSLLLWSIDPCEQKSNNINI